MAQAQQQARQDKYHTPTWLCKPVTWFDASCLQFVWACLTNGSPWGSFHRLGMDYQATRAQMQRRFHTITPRPMPLALHPWHSADPAAKVQFPKNRTSKPSGPPPVPLSPSSPLSFRPHKRQSARHCFYKATQHSPGVVQCLKGPITTRHLHCDHPGSNHDWSMIVWPAVVSAAAGNGCRRCGLCICVVVPTPMIWMVRMICMQ